MSTLFQDIVSAGIPYANHESDLYVPDTPQVREIIAKHQRGMVASFVNQAEPHKGQRWLDVPFAYEPWWQRRISAKAQPKA